MLARMMSVAVLLVSAMGITAGKMNFTTLLKSCPSEFYVQSYPMDKNPIYIRARYGKKYCSQIPTDSVDIKEEKDLSPSMELARWNDHYRINFSWTVSAIKRTHYPKKFIVHLKLLQEDVSLEKKEEYEEICIRLNLRRRKVGPEIETQFHLDCIPVITEPHIWMSAKIWSLQDASQYGQCRHRRSLPSTCSTAKTFKPNFIRLSLGKNTQLTTTSTLIRDGNELELCAMSEAIPVLKWEQLETGYFLVNFTNLRPYIRNVYVTIKNGVDTFEEKHLKHQDIHNRSISIKSDKQPTSPGIYSVHFYSDCINFDEHKSSHLDQSRAWDYSRQNITVVLKKHIRRPASNFETLLVVMIIVGAMAVVVLTFALSHRPKSHSSKLNVQLPDVSVNNRNQSGGTESVPDESVELMTDENKQNPDENDWESVHNKAEAAGPINDPITMDNKTETHPSHTTGTSFNGCDGDCTQYKLKMSISEAKHDSKSNSCSGDCLLLFQPEYKNLEFTKSLSIFFEIIDQTTNVRLCKGSGPRESWTDFGKSAAERFHHIILIVTKSFCDLCTLLEDHDNSDYLEALLRERNFEEVPAMVLNSVKNSVNEERNSNAILHLVSLDVCIQRGQSVVEQFLLNHKFLCQTTHYIYYITDILNHTNSQELSENLTILKTRLTTSFR